MTVRVPRVLVPLAVAFSLASFLMATLQFLHVGGLFDLRYLGVLPYQAYWLGLGAFAVCASLSLGWVGFRQRLGIMKRSGVFLGLLGGTLLAMIPFLPGGYSLVFFVFVWIGLPFALAGPVLSAAATSLLGRRRGRIVIAFAWAGALLLMFWATRVVFGGAVWLVEGGLALRRPTTLTDSILHWLFLSGSQYNALLVIGATCIFAAAAAIATLSGRGRASRALTVSRVSFLGLGVMAVAGLGAAAVGIPVLLSATMRVPILWEGLLEVFPLMSAVAPAAFALGFSLVLLGTPGLCGERSTRTRPESRHASEA